MATRAQIDRMIRQVDKLALTLTGASTAHVPIYIDETEAEAVAAYGQPTPSKVVFNRACPGDRRGDCEANGMDAFYRLSPSEVHQLLSQIDGKTRQLPPATVLTSEKGSTA
jgi:hypothetical protein